MGCHNLDFGLTSRLLKEQSMNERLCSPAGGSQLTSTSGYANKARQCTPNDVDFSNASVSENISPDVKVTESSGGDERDCSEHRPLSDSETESVEMETKIAKSVGKMNTPSESPHSSKILKVKLPIESTLKFSKELWNSLYKEAYTKNGKIYLSQRWTNVLTKQWVRSRNFIVALSPSAILFQRMRKVLICSHVHSIAGLVKVYVI